MVVLLTFFIIQSYRNSNTLIALVDQMIMIEAIMLAIQSNPVI